METRRPRGQDSGLPSFCITIIIDTFIQLLFWFLVISGLINLDGSFFSAFIFIFARLLIVRCI